MSMTLVAGTYNIEFDKHCSSLAWSELISSSDLVAIPTRKLQIIIKLNNILKGKNWAILICTPFKTSIMTWMLNGFKDELNLIYHLFVSRFQKQLQLSLMLLIRLLNVNFRGFVHFVFECSVHSPHTSLSKMLLEGTC